MLVSQVMYGRRERLAKERSGEEGWPLVGSRVGLSSLRVARLESPISSAKVLPLASLSCECQSESWAFRSPRIRVSSVFIKGIREGL